MCVGMHLHAVPWGPAGNVKHNSQWNLCVYSPVIDLYSASVIRIFPDLFYLLCSQKWTSKFIQQCSAVRSQVLHIVKQTEESRMREMQWIVWKAWVFMSLHDDLVLKLFLNLWLVTRHGGTGYPQYLLLTSALKNTMVCWLPIEMHVRG